MKSLVLILALFCVGAVAAQTAPAGKATSGSAGNSSAKGAAESKSVKAESVTINMPEGMTKDQADAILNELKAIHQLLSNQQNANGTLDGERLVGAVPISVFEAEIKKFMPATP